MIRKTVNTLSLKGGLSLLRRSYLRIYLIKRLDTYPQNRRIKQNKQTSG